MFVTGSDQFVNRYPRYTGETSGDEQNRIARLSKLIELQLLREFIRAARIIRSISVQNSTTRFYCN